MTSANDILMSGGGRFHKFANPGDTITGTITNLGEPYQAREFNNATQKCDGPLKFTKAGKPVYEFQVHLQTTERADAEDDGVRVLTVNSWRMQAAIRDACRAAGAMSGLQLGGTLTVTYTGDEVPGDNRSGKKYTSTYVGGANAALMTDDPAPAPAAAPVTPAPASVIAPVTAAPAPVSTETSQIPGLSPEAFAAFQAYQAQQQKSA